MKMWLWGHFKIIVLSLFLWEFSRIITLVRANALQVNINYNQDFYLWCQIGKVFEIFPYETGWWNLIKYSSLSVGTNVPFEMVVCDWLLDICFKRLGEFLLSFSYFPECLVSLDITASSPASVNKDTKSSQPKGRRAQDQVSGTIACIEHTHSLWGQCHSPEAKSDSISLKTCWLCV